MFDNYYHFQKVGELQANNKRYLECLLTYSFRTDPYERTKRNTTVIHKGNIYIVEVEKYNYNMYVIKYYPKKSKNDPRRFNILTGENKCSKIVGTCLQIMLSILSKDKFANFGFLGAHSINTITNIEEDKSNTKRFRVYKRAMENLFGEDNFTHFFNPNNSTYIILNNNNDNHQDIINASNEMFEYLFPDLEQ